MSDRFRATARWSDPGRVIRRFGDGPVKKLQTRLRALQNRRDRGASAVEYGLLVALIAVVIAATVYALGGALKDRFSNANKCVAAPASAGSCTP